MCAIPSLEFFITYDKQGTPANATTNYINSTWSLELSSLRHFKGNFGKLQKYA